MGLTNEIEFEAIEARAQRMHLRAELLPWVTLSGRDKDVWLAAAELEMCRDGLLPSHRHCRGDHSLFDAFERWEEADVRDE